MPGDPFDIDVPPDTPLRRAAYVAARPLLSWGLQLRTLSRLYRTLDRQSTQTFAVRALDALGVDVRDARTSRHVPRRGAAVIVANHPHGALDGLVLLAAVQQVRPDVRLLANYLLARIPELRDACFFVDPFGAAGAAMRSTSGLRAAQRWLGQGGALIACPAGEVAHQWRNGVLRDSRWQLTTSRLAIAAQAQVVPVNVAGHNRRLFYLAGLVHPALRTGLLSRELLAKRNQSVRLRFGPPLEAAVLAGEPEAVTHRMRAAVERLATEDAQGAS